MLEFFCVKAVEENRRCRLVDEMRMTAGTPVGDATAKVRAPINVRAWWARRKEEKEREQIEKRTENNEKRFGKDKLLNAFPCFLSR